MSQAQSMQGQAAGSAAASHPVTLSAEELAMLSEVFGPNIFEAAVRQYSANDTIPFFSLEHRPICSADWTGQAYAER